MNLPFSEVTIISPNYNKGSFVKECIDSVKNQTFQDWKLIIIDDNSSDGSDKLCQNEAATDTRIFFKRNQRDTKGANAARNYGLELSNSKYVIFLDSDDLISPDFLQERMDDFRLNSELDFIAYPMAFFFDRPGDSKLISNVPTDEDFLDRFLQRDIVWQITGPTWKTEYLKKLGGFDLSLNSQQDVDLHIRALISGAKFKYVHVQPRSFYRRNVSSQARKNSQTVEHLQARYQMVLNHRKLLQEQKILTDRRKIYLARYILDLSQMMRWHLKELGFEAKRIAFDMWKITYDNGLVSKQVYHDGKNYIRFKHQMLYNRIPVVQKSIEKYFRKKLAEYIHERSKTYGQLEYGSK